MAILASSNDDSKRCNYAGVTPIPKPNAILWMELRTDSGYPSQTCGPKPKYCGFPLDDQRLPLAIVIFSLI
jgi:hypothetical protein